MNNRKHFVIGLGEVGKAIQLTFEAEGIDQGEEMQYPYDSVKYMHICFPYLTEEQFSNEVKRYQGIYKPEFTIIHSTVPVGTSRKLDAIHSPIRGRHPHLYEGIKTFVKFISGWNASLVADEFRRAGLRVMLFKDQETTELGKLLDTEYYRACIEFMHTANGCCKLYNLNFHEVYTLFNQTYNEGYERLGNPEYIRPVLQPIETEIGGHCVMPNKELLYGKEGYVLSNLK